MLLIPIASCYAKATSKCTFPVKRECMTNLPKDWQPKTGPDSPPFTIEEVCLKISDYPPDPDLCNVSGTMKVSVDLANFVSGIVGSVSTVHNDDLDLWVKASGLEPGDPHTIRTVTYMQATTYERILWVKTQTDEWHPDVKCAISLKNPEDRSSCLATNATGSAGLLSLSSSCSFNQHKDNNVLKDIGAVLLGTLGGPIGFVKGIIGLYPGSPSSVPSMSAKGELPTGSAVEVAAIYTCPDDVQALNNGTELLITRSYPRDYHLAHDLADQWNQEPTLASHIRGEIPKSVTAAKGDSYWRLAEQYYSSGRYWIGIAQANKWHKLAIGSTIQLPPMQELLFAPCFIRQRESLWTAGVRLKQPPGSVGVSTSDLVARPKGRDSVYPLEQLKIRLGSNCPS